MRLIDTSHVVEAGMTTYPGLPGPVIDDHLTFDDSAGHYALGTEFTIGRITMVANTGTYLETPTHRFRDGYDLAGLPLDRCAGLPAVVVDAGPGPIGPAVLAGRQVESAAVLFRTGWDRHWGTDRYGDVSHPHLTEQAAELWWRQARASSASTRSTSTTPPVVTAQRTPCCWPPGSRSLST